MMKKNKTISIDIDVYYLLVEKKVNTSKIVNKFLRSYLKIENRLGMSKADIDNQITKRRAELIKLENQKEKIVKEDAEWQ